MTITKDVIRDLMPLYLAGEGSPDTRRLVEEFLQAHPDEAPSARASDAFGIPDIDPPSDRIEMASLDRTRKLYGRRSTALAAAMALSYSVFSFQFAPEGVTFILFRDAAIAAWVLLAAAAVAWCVFLFLHRRFAATGLAGSPKPFPSVWMAGGMAAAVPYAFVIAHRFGFPDMQAACLMGASAGAALGAALSRVPKRNPSSASER